MATMTYGMHEVTDDVIPSFVPTATVIDLPDASPGFEDIAFAADDAMWLVLAEDFELSFVEDHDDE